MDTKKGSLLVGAGFLLGTLGVKALTSEPAKKCYVQGVACGLRARNAYQDIVEEAKAQLTTSLQKQPISPKAKPLKKKLLKRKSKKPKKQKVPSKEGLTYGFLNH